MPDVPTCHDMLRAHVPNFLTCQRAMTCYVPTCQRAYVPNFLTCQRATTCYVPTCQRAYVPNFLTCQRAMTCYVPTCQRAYVPNFFTCQRDIACYVPTCLWPNFLTCQCAIACYVQTCKRSCPSCANLPAYQIVVCGPFVGSFLNFWAIQLQTVSFEAYFSSFAKGSGIEEILDNF